MKNLSLWNEEFVKEILQLSKFKEFVKEILQLSKFVKILHCEMKNLSKKKGNNLKQSSDRIGDFEGTVK